MTRSLPAACADIWRGSERLTAAGETIPTGFPSLDAVLPGGGWPVGALTELLSQEGAGALRLVMPALAHLSHRERWIAWVGPPYIPYAPALADMGMKLGKILLIHPRIHRDGLWAVEQALGAGTCSAVLAWPAGPDTRALRRLQLAAEKGRTWGLLFRPRDCARQPSPAALRALVETISGGIAVTVLKCRGPRPGRPVELPVNDAVASPAPVWKLCNLLQV